MLKQITLTSLGFPLVDKLKINKHEYYKTSNQMKRKGNINHSVCKWCYGEISLEEFAVNVKSIGITGIDLIGHEQWPILKKHNLKNLILLKNQLTVFHFVTALTSIINLPKTFWP